MWINLIVLDVVFFEVVFFDEAAFLEVDFLVEADFLVVVFLLSFLDSDFLVDLAVEVEVTTFLPLDLRV
ncbi:hypothetical protein IMAU60066_01792 [Lactobacillus helveticus]|nr:hypothetical protein [Lactobacillus helveticus]